MEDTLKRYARAMLGIIGFAVAMGLRDELSSSAMRALVAGLAGGFFWTALSCAPRSSDRS